MIPYLSRPAPMMRPAFARLEKLRLYAEAQAAQPGSAAYWKLIAISIAVIAVIGMPLFAILGSVAIYLWWSDDAPTRRVAPTVLADQFAASPLLITIPLFTFAGYLMAESKTPVRLVRAASAALGWMPGGLAVVCIAASAFFTTMTGGSGVTIVAVGGFLYPALIRQGYPKDFSLGLVTSAGAIGLLFPPSPLVMIYSVVAGVDMNSAYLATSIPALGLMIVLAAYAIYVGKTRNVPRTPFDPKELAIALWEVKWELMAPLLVAFSILTGLMKLEEAAAAAALYFLIVEVYIYRDLQWGSVMRIAKDAIVLAGSLILILTMATAMSNYIVDGNIANKLLNWFINALSVSKDHPELEQWKFVLALNVFLFIVGMLMDGFSTILVGLPLLRPLAQAFGIHPLHMAVMFLLNMELAYIMPPAGLNLFISSFRFNRPVAQVYRVVIPYVILLHIGLIALIVFPSFSTFTVTKKTAELRAKAEQTHSPPTDAWLIQCVQMDLAHPIPCTREEKVQWGSNWEEIQEKMMTANTPPEPVESAQPANSNAPDVKNFTKDQNDLLNQMMGDTKPKANTPDVKNFTKDQNDLLQQMMGDTKPKASAAPSAGPKAP